MSLAFVAITLLSTSLQAQDTVVVHVVDGRTKQAIEGAELRWCIEPLSALPTRNDSDSDPYGFERSRMEGFEEVDRQCKASARADSKGDVHIAYSEGSLHLIATHGSLFGTTECFTPLLSSNGAWPASFGPVDLDLWPDQNLDVDVVDSEGKALGACAVVLRETWSSSPSDELLAMSDANGRAQLRHAGWLITDTVNTGPITDASNQLRFSVTFGGCLATPKPFALNPAALPSTPIRLTMPPTGSVEVSITNADGSLASVEIPLMIVPKSDHVPVTPEGGTLAWVAELSGHAPAEGASAPVFQGKAVFERVGLGQELALLARRNPASATSSTVIHGPTKPGERVACDLVLGSTTTRLHGRLLKPDGAPLARASVTSALWSGPSPRRAQFYDRSGDEYVRGFRELFESGPSGEFEIDMDLSLAYAGAPLWVITYHRNQPDALSRCVDLSELLDPGELAPGLPGLRESSARNRSTTVAARDHDFGDLALAPSPVIASGRVVNETGHGVAGAFVSVGVFKGTPYIFATTDLDGRFALRGSEPNDPVELEVSMATLVPFFARDIKRGAAEISVTLRASGGIRLRAALPDGVPMDRTSVSVEREGPEPQGSGTNSNGGLDDGQFEAHELLPGKFKIRISQGGQTLWEQTEVEVRAHEVTDLGTIDLRGRTRKIELQLVDKDRAPITHCFYSLGDPGKVSIDSLWYPSGIDRLPHDLQGGKLLLASDREHADLVVFSTGYRFGLFRDVQDGQELRLESGIPVKFAIKKPFGPVPEKKLLRLSLAKPWEIGSHRFPTQLGIDSEEVGVDGIATIRAPAPGQYDLVWVLGDRGTQNWSGTTDQKVKVDVQDTTNAQQYEVEVPDKFFDEH